MWQKDNDMEALTIRLSELMDNTSLVRSGENLYDAIVGHITRREPVKIDMADVPALPTVFMNPVFGRLILQHGKRNVASLLTFSNIMRSQLTRFKDYFNSFDN